MSKLIELIISAVLFGALVAAGVVAPGEENVLIPNAESAAAAEAAYQEYLAQNPEGVLLPEVEIVSSSIKVSPTPPKATATPAPTPAPAEPQGSDAIFLENGDIQLPLAP